MNGSGKRRIVLIASGDLWAGAEVMVYQLISGLVSNGTLDLRIVLMNKGRLALELERLGVVFYIVDESKNSLRKSIGIIRGLIRKFGPDMIHSHRYKENFLAWCASRGLPGCRLMATQHGLPETVGHLSVNQRLRNALFFRLLSFGFSRTVAVSKEMRQSLVGRYGFTEKNVTVIHNGIRVPGHVITSSGVKLVVGSAGRLFPVKDFPLLVEVARIVMQQNDRVDFVLAGDGPEMDRLKQLVQCYGLEGRFRFLGHQEDMAAFYEGLHVYVNTSVHEGIPMSVLEAMSHGLPVVVPRVGGFPEIVEDGVSGFLVGGRDPSKFAQCILGLLDPGRREPMGRAARERIITSFSREVMTQRYVELYHELAGL